MKAYRKDSVKDLYGAGFRDLIVCGVGEVEARDDRISALEALAGHMRHCGECAETGVIRCPDGKPLWVLAMGGGE